MGREDNEPPVPAHMLPEHWDETLSRRKDELGGLRWMVKCSQFWDSDYDIHDQSCGGLRQGQPKWSTDFPQEFDQYDFVAAVDNAPADLWSRGFDESFERCADQWRGYAAHGWMSDVRHGLKAEFADLEGTVSEILKSDRTGRHFMRCSATEAKSYWDREHMGWRRVQWAAGFVFTKMRREIRWELFPLGRCTLCGIQMEHWSDQAIGAAGAGDYGVGGSTRWCKRCCGLTSGFATRREVLAALRAYVAATGVVPVNQRMLGNIPHTLPGQVRDVMRAVRTTVGNLRENDLYPWNKALVAAGVVDEFVQSPRGLQSESEDGHWCLSIFERQVDDFLTHNGIAHEHEPKWPKHPELNPRGQMRADWRLYDGTMVEAAGMMEVPQYAAKMDKKQMLADATGIKLLVLTPEKLTYLDRIFKPWLAATPNHRD